MTNSPHSSLRKWLFVIICLVVLMVALGGITRLTGSGLSITEWKPIMGAIPPLNDEEWVIAFEKYKLIPQYQAINSDMLLSEFKWIFFWEYLHRLVGRLIGLAFFFPLAYFWLRRKIPAGFHRKLIGLFLLGGAQGAMGWFMVMSGLSELTYVSHIRLMLHLMLAFTIAGYAWWVFKEIGELANPQSRPFTPQWTRATRVLFGMVFLQCVYGAFTAGLKAGYQYPTFPTFLGEWVPEALLEKDPLAINFISNPVTVQWIHRILGTVIVIFSMAVWARARKSLAHRGQRRAITAPAHWSATQYVIGIFLVLNGVPLGLGAFHQITGCLLFIFTVNALYEFRPSSRGQ